MHAKPFFQTTSSNLDTSFISNQSDDLFDDETPYDQEEEQDDDDFFTSSQENCSTDTDPEDLNAPENTERKYVIFKSCIGTLLKYCPDCGAVITERNESASGSMLSIKILCIHGHETLWNSQPLINKTPAGNILIAAPILFSGKEANRFLSYWNTRGLPFPYAQVLPKEGTLFLQRHASSRTACCIR